MNEKLLWNIAGHGAKIRNHLIFPFKNDNSSIIRFDPSVGTDNLGDCIIMQYCDKVLNDLFPSHEAISIGTHLMPTLEQERISAQAKYKFVCGTNLLTSHIEHHWRWILPDGFCQKQKYGNVILLGVGWGEYQDKCSDYSKLIYRAMLNPCVFHSVRDQYTLKKLEQIGFSNVINTGCPTTWALTKEFCQKIPSYKADEVVATITDYRRDAKRDNEMLKILSKNYRHIHLWLQGKSDDEYLKALEVPVNLSIISRDLIAYEKILAQGNIDYVGTRLHAGIHALNHQVRTIILAVDNRATEMGHDINLPIIQRDNINEELEAKIRCNFVTDIRINQTNIDLFKAQFRS